MSQIRVTKTNRLSGESVLVPLLDALHALRHFNQPYTYDKTDAELIEQLKLGQIYTNLNAYQIKET